MVDAVDIVSFDSGARVLVTPSSRIASATRFPTDPANPLSVILTAVPVDVKFARRFQLIPEE